MAKTPFRSPVPGNVGAGPRGGDPDFRSKTEFLRRWWKEPQAYPDEFKSWLINFIEHHPDLLLEESAIPRIHWSKIIDPQTGATPDEWIVGSGPPASATGKVGDLYLDSSNGSFYEKTATSTWTLKGSIAGSPGAVGPPGPTGPAGTVYDSDQIGVVKSWTGKTIPTNWRLCNGQTISETVAPDLAAFAAAEVAAGNPLWGISGSAPNRTITLPNLTNKFIYGVAQTDLSDMGAPGGAATVALTIAQMPSHNHFYAPAGTATSGASNRGGVTNAGEGGHYHEATAGQGAYMLNAGGATFVMGSGASTRPSPTSVDAVIYPSGVSLSSAHQHNITTNDHTHTIYFEGGGGAHENMPPYTRLAHIVKVMGPMINPGGALIGQTGPQGPQGVQGVTGSQGPQGATGATGSTGPTGTAGSVWRSGSGAPAGALGVVGDWYLNTANGDVYEKTGASAWTLRDNLTGPQGIQGIQGPQGNTGTTGAQGTPGEKWFSQAGAPAGGTGIVGDWSLDTTAGDVYEKTGASTWTWRANVKGPTGAAGPFWFTQAGAPGVGTGVIGDLALDTTTGDYYRKTGASTWTLQGNLKGPTGATGSTGSTGPQGNVGPAGPTGPTGADSTVPGPAGAKGDPGPWRGAWAAGTAYAIGDSVSYFDGTVTGSYRRKVAGTTAGNPKTDTTNWEIIASGGSVGADGAVAVYEQAGTPASTQVGAVWIDTDDVAPAFASLVPLVTALPSNPVDGQEVYYQADAVSGVIWHLRYRAASASAYKWEFVGGPPLIAQTDVDQSSAGGVGLHADPILTLPRAGDYLLTFNNLVQSQSGQAAGLQIQHGCRLNDGTADLTPADLYYDSFFYVQAAGNPLYRQNLNIPPTLKSGLPAGTTLRLKAYVVNWDYTSLSRSISALPVRLS